MPKQRAPNDGYRAAESLVDVLLVCGAGDLLHVHSGEHTDGDAIAGGPFGLVWRNRRIEHLAEGHGVGGDVVGELGVACGTRGVLKALIAGERAGRQRVPVVRLVVVRSFAWN